MCRDTGVHFSSTVEQFYLPCKPKAQLAPSVHLPIVQVLSLSGSLVYVAPEKCERQDHGHMRSCWLLASLACFFSTSCSSPAAPLVASYPELE